MTHSRNKGLRYERAVERFLVDADADYEKANRSGFDGADGTLGPFLSVEIKNHAKMELGRWIDQATADAAGRLPVVIHKRRGTADVGDHYATFPVWALVALLERLGGAE